MFKVIITANKAPGISREELIDRYENGHIPMTERLIANGDIPPMLDYRRNYLAPGDTEEASSFCDVITEVWYASREDYENNMEAISSPKLVGPIRKDLESFLDISTIRYYVVDEFPK